MIIQDMKKYLQNKKGFTLIELLVVIAIIGVLSALLTSNFIGVRQRARDAQRKSDLRQIQSALELYRADVGNYPSNSMLASCGTTTAKIYNGSSTYMQQIPCDPTTGSVYTYNTSDNTTYTLITCLENGSDSQKDSVNVSPCDGTTNFSYTLRNP